MVNLTTLFKSKKERKIRCKHCNKPVEYIDELTIYTTNPVFSDLNNVPFHKNCFDKMNEERSIPKLFSFKLPVKLSATEHSKYLWGGFLTAYLLIVSFVDILEIVGSLVLGATILFSLFSVKRSLFPIPLMSNKYLVFLLISLIMASAVLIEIWISNIFPIDMELRALGTSMMWLWVFIFFGLARLNSFQEFELPLKLGLKERA